MKILKREPVSVIKAFSSGRSNFYSIDNGKGIVTMIDCDLRKEKVEKTFIGIVDELEMWGYYEIPAPEQLKDDIKALNRFREYEINENVIKKYSIRNGRESMAYAYSNEKYEVVFPKSPMEMCREAAAQRNCLLNYVNGHADKLTTVLFVRKCESHNKPFVTMEVKDNVVVQALARFNRVPDSDVQAFVKEYANVKGFYLREEAEKYFDYQEDFFF